MTDTQRRGQRAKELLDDPLIIEAFKEIEQAIQDQWKVSIDTSDREKLWYTYQGLQRFKHYLDVTIENGQFEKALLEKQDG